MKVRIQETFEGYPDGKTKREFRAGTVPELPDDFAKLIIAKGHAVADGTPTPPVAPKAG